LRHNFTQNLKMFLYIQVLLLYEWLWPACSIVHSDMRVHYLSLTHGCLELLTLFPFCTEIIAIVIKPEKNVIYKLVCELLVIYIVYKINTSKQPFDWSTANSRNVVCDIYIVTV
jgi:hypothetical protein